MYCMLTYYYHCMYNIMHAGTTIKILNGKGNISIAHIPSIQFGSHLHGDRYTYIAIYTITKNLT